jgi:hypothetical protein
LRIYSPSGLVGRGRVFFAWLLRREVVDYVPWWSEIPHGTGVGGLGVARLKDQVSVLHKVFAQFVLASIVSFLDTHNFLCEIFLSGLFKHLVFGIIGQVLVFMKILGTGHRPFESMLELRFLLVNLLSKVHGF